MNGIGGSFQTGEGDEGPARYGANKCRASKQVASVALSAPAYLVDTVIRTSLRCENQVNDRYRVFVTHLLPGCYSVPGVTDLPPPRRYLLY